MSQIRIKNLGPIIDGFEEKDGFLDIPKATVFIGNQGTGKSSVAKLISTMTWLEKALQRGDLTKKDLERYNRFVNNYCAYQGLKNYFKPDTEVSYKGDAWSIEYKKGKIWADYYNPTLPPLFELDSVTKYKMPKIMYIPAERNFLSAVNKPDKLKGLPSPLLTFLTEYEKAQEAMRDRVALPIGDVSFEYDKLNKLANIRGRDFKIGLSEASSGFQSSVPMFVVSQYLANYVAHNISDSKTDASAANERRLREEVQRIFSNPNLTEEVKNAALEALSAKFSYGRFINIVEEPEQNLYPSSQRHILNKLLAFANLTDGNRLILTTHSPYIINYLSIAIQAHELQAKIAGGSPEDIAPLSARLAEIVPLDSCVASNEVAVYQLTEQGKIHRLPDYEGIPSDKNYLNLSLSEGNQLFDALLEIEESCQ